MVGPDPDLGDQEVVGSVVVKTEVVSGWCYYHAKVHTGGNTPTDRGKGTLLRYQNGAFVDSFSCFVGTGSTDCDTRWVVANSSMWTFVAAGYRQSKEGTTFKTYAWGQTDPPSR